MLSQCTGRLGLTNAAQKVFTEDGTLVLEIDDLVDWAVNNYKALMVDQLERIMAGEKQQQEPEQTEEEEGQGQNLGHGRQQRLTKQSDERDESEEEDEDLGGDSLMRQIAAKKRDRGLAQINERGEGEGRDSPNGVDPDENESAGL